MHMQLLEAVGAGQSTLLEEGSNTLDTIFSGIDFNVLSTNYGKALALAVPVTIGILALKKGAGWIMGMIRRA